MFVVSGVVSYWNYFFVNQQLGAVTSQSFHSEVAKFGTIMPVQRPLATRAVAGNTAYWCWANVYTVVIVFVFL